MKRWIFALILAVSGCEYMDQSPEKNRAKFFMDCLERARYIVNTDHYTGIVSACGEQADRFFPVVSRKETK